MRFSREEAAAYLNDVMEPDLAAADIDALEGRTEGWIAALQLATPSLQGRDDPAVFIAGFAGDDRFVVDYLVGEVASAGCAAGLRRRGSAVMNACRRVWV